MQPAPPRGNASGYLSDTEGLTFPDIAKKLEVDVATLYCHLAPRPEVAPTASGEQSAARVGSSRPPAPSPPSVRASLASKPSRPSTANRSRSSPGPRRTTRSRRGPRNLSRWL